MLFITAAAPTPSEGGQQQLPVVDFSSLSLVIAGGVLITTIGFLTIIAGIVIIVVIDSRKRGGEQKEGGRGVTEGGITYRKD